VKVTARIFLSYAREDEEKVESLYKKLSDAGFKPWMDIKDILPGERWESCIARAIGQSDFFLVCLSANSIDKKGYMHKEIREALNMWQLQLEDDIYLIPVRLEDCEVPESVRGFQWVNLFEVDGWEQLAKAIQIGMERRAEVIADAMSSLQRRFSRPYLPWRNIDVPITKIMEQWKHNQQRNFQETANLFDVSVSQLQDALAMLGPRHRKILEMRYGLSKFGQRTREEIAQEFGLPAWRIEEIEKEGLVKLKQALLSIKRRKNRDV
jgi:RNA polymerase sigma factor (sigma-70 family)